MAALTVVSSRFNFRNVDLIYLSIYTTTTTTKKDQKLSEKLAFVVVALKKKIPFLSTEPSLRFPFKQVHEVHAWIWSIIGRSQWRVGSGRGWQEGRMESSIEPPPDRLLVDIQPLLLAKSDNASDPIPRYYQRQCCRRYISTATQLTKPVSTCNAWSGYWKRKTYLSRPSNPVTETGKKNGLKPSTWR